MSINHVQPQQQEPNNKQLLDLLSQADQLTLPEGFEDTTSWRRAQRYTSIVGSRNPGQWQISLPRANGSIGGDYVVTFCVESHEHDSHILSNCQCKGYEFNDICCHVLYFWWKFANQNILVYDIETRQYLEAPPENLNLTGTQADQELELDQEEAPA